MKKHFQNMFIVPGSYLDQDFSLDFRGTIDDDGEWIDGDLGPHLDCPRVGKIRNRVAYFVGRDFDGWGNDEDLQKREWAQRMSASELILRNYEARNLASLTDDTSRYRYYRKIESLTNGLILEVAVGPGGGFFPNILKINPDKKILANDIGAWIVEEWQQLSERMRLGSNISFSQFDMKYAPMRSDTFDCVLCAGGMSSIPGVTKVIEEILRILKPGGLLFMADGSITQEAYDSLSEEGKAELAARFPDALKEYYLAKIHDAGFKQIKLEVTGKGVSRPEEGLWGEFGQKYGIEFEKDYYSIIATK